ncbi:hypothetical protein [Vibrio crassostreae]|uniref:hypothetical protein n=1 Tax=Vibrio crassostreae TaxID=246167 RepID=UPI001B315433|nr:hypothetical protein [Vibrio crassostreae]
MKTGTTTLRETLKDHGFEITHISENGQYVACVCSEGHQLGRESKDMLANPECPVCKLSKSKVSATMVRKARGQHVISYIAILKGGYVTTKIPFTKYHAPISINCGNGHDIEPIANDIRNGAWCSKCAKNRSYSLELLQKFVEDAHGGEVTSSTFNNLEETYWFKCNVGHKFPLKGRQVVSDDTWCPECAKEKARINHQKTWMETLTKVAEENQGKLLSENYINSKTKMKFMCKREHEFYRSSKEVRDGEWCPKCEAIDGLLDIL